MRLCSCENPRMIYSKELEQYVRVSCGKCKTCQDSRVARWVQKLDAESQHHKYTFFVTLTYSDDNIPAYFYSDDMQSLVSNRSCLERIPLDEIHGYLNDDLKEYDYLCSRLVHPLGLPVICPKDISDFFKRFNKYCFSHVTHHYQNIRYFAAWEYGSGTFRPHVHLLCWFDEDSIKDRFNEILHKTWTLGFFDASSVFSHGGRSYVAKYVNKSPDLPKIYSFPKICPKTQFSKSPSIGSLPILDEAIRYYFDTKPCKRSVWNSSSSKYIDLPIEQCVKDRFFPKCPEYYRRSHYDRVTLYGITVLIPSDTFEEFRFSLDRCRWLAYRGIANDDERDFARYYEKLIKNSKNDSSLKTSLYRLYRMSNLVCWNARRLGITLDSYVYGIEEFYKRIDYENLKSQLQFEHDYVNVNSHSLSDLIHLYPDFSTYVEKYCVGYENKFSPEIPLWIAFAMASFGINSPSDYKPLEDTFDYKSMKALHNKISLESDKRIKANQYRDKQLCQSDSKLASILNQYCYGK